MNLEDEIIVAKIAVKMRANLPSYDNRIGNIIIDRQKEDIKRGERWLQWVKQCEGGDGCQNKSGGQ